MQKIALKTWDNIFNHALLNCMQVMYIFLPSEQFRLEVPVWSMRLGILQSAQVQLLLKTHWVSKEMFTQDTFLNSKTVCRGLGMHFKGWTAFNLTLKRCLKKTKLRCDTTAKCPYDKPVHRPTDGSKCLKAYIFT